MNTTMTVTEVTNELNRIAAQIRAMRDENFRAWSRTQLWPRKIENWAALADDLCALYEVLEGYLALVEDWSLVFDQEKLDTLAAWTAFRDFRLKYERRFTSRIGTGDVQRLVWALLWAFPERHEAYVKSLVESGA